MSQTVTHNSQQHDAATQLDSVLSQLREACRDAGAWQVGSTMHDDGVVTVTFIYGDLNQLAEQIDEPTDVVLASEERPAVAEAATDAT